MSKLDRSVRNQVFKHIVKKLQDPSAKLALEYEDSVEDFDTGFKFSKHGMHYPAVVGVTRFQRFRIARAIKKWKKVSNIKLQESRNDSET